MAEDKKRLDLGPTGQAVAANLARLREDAGLNFTQLSARLSGGGRPMSAVTIRRIETQHRRVDADDLVALAVALDVSPITLLMPKTEKLRDEVAASGLSYPVSAGTLWYWLRADTPMQGDHRMKMVFQAEAWPEWFFNRYYEEKRQRDAAWIAGRQAVAAAGMSDPERAEKLAEIFKVDDGDD